MDGKLFLNRRHVFPIALALLLAVVLSYVQISPFGVRPAQAAIQLATSSSILSAVPAAAADNQDNRFVFWRGTDPGHGLWEGFYEASAAKWYGPNLIAGMGPLGSEPTVTVDTDNTSLGYAHQFVFWQGADGGLWMAWWDGSWHGPENLYMGSLGSKPSASYDTSYHVLTVVWKGRDGNLWYTHDQLNPDGSQQAWQGPFSASWGPLGGPPAAGDAGYGTELVTWRGQDGYLWYGELLATGGVEYGPGEVKLAGLPGSDPNVAGNPAGTFSSAAGDYQEVSWAGLDRGLWTIDWSPVLGTPAGAFSPTSLREVSNMGPLGSAPSCAILASDTYNCYWAGANAGYSLWEMTQNFENGLSGPNNLGMGPLQ